MNPYDLMASDMKTLRLSSQKIFELWNDSVSANLESGCINELQKAWNLYAEDMNTRMKRVMLAEHSIEEKLERIKNVAGQQ